MSEIELNNTHNVSAHCDAANVLHVDFSSFLRFECKVAFMPWGQGMKWRNTSEDSENEGDLHLQDPGIPFSFFVSSPEAQPWLATIPDELIKKIAQFDIMFSGVTFPMLAFISRSNRTKELFESAPFLMGLILFSAKYHQRSYQEILEIAQDKRKDILSACGIAGEKFVQKVLNKISLEMFGIRDYQCLMDFGWTDNIKLLGHLDYVDMKLLRFISSESQFSTARFLFEYHAEWNWSNVQLIIHDIESMARRMAITNPVERINRCRNLIELNRLHDRFVERLNERKLENMPLIEFPEPPIKGTDKIIPIRNNKELMIEGKTQRHCVSSYENAVILGTYYVYCVMEPERATLGLNIRGDGKVFVNQIKLICNGAPSLETKKMIETWLSSECAISNERCIGR